MGAPQTVFNKKLSTRSSFRWFSSCEFGIQTLPRRTSSNLETCLTTKESLAQNFGLVVELCCPGIDLIRQVVARFLATEQLGSFESQGVPLPLQPLKFQATEFCSKQLENSSSKETRLGVLGLIVIHGLCESLFDQQCPLISDYFSNTLRATLESSFSIFSSSWMKRPTRFVHLVHHDRLIWFVKFEINLASRAMQNIVFSKYYFIVLPICDAQCFTVR